MEKYEKLTHDLRQAKENALKAIIGEDGGSANLDCMTIELKGWREEKVKNAVSDAGLYTRGRREWIGRRFFINPPGAGQGNDRCRAVEAMCETMRKLGYDVLMFQRAD